MKSELRTKIEDAVRRVACESGEALIHAKARLCSLLDELDAMAERDALWEKMDFNEVAVSKGRLGYAAGSPVAMECESGHATPLAAVQALVSKIEEGK